MGGCLNIEVHQSLKSNDHFTSSLKNILKTVLDQEQLIKFINSVKLQSEKKHSWFEYENIKVKFRLNKNVGQLEWGIFLDYNQNEYKYVLELNILETEIQIYEDGKPYFEVEKTNQILSLMKQIHKSNEKAIILFTDEASQGKLVENLNVNNVDINYLFDLAILPMGLNWQNDISKYDKIEKIGGSEVWKSKSSYMRKFKTLV